MARGHIRRRGQDPHRWTIYIYRGVDPATGKKRWGTKVFRGTRREAEIERTRLQAEQDRGGVADPSREPLGEFLERWLREYAEVKVKANTCEFYQSKVRKYIIPALGRVRVDQLTPLQVQSLESECLRRGLSSRSVLHIHRVLSQALKWGVRMGCLSRNVAELVDPPRPKKYQARFLDWSEVRILLEAVGPTCYRDLVLLALLTGLRRSELLALRWQDVDLDNGHMSVSRSLVRLDDGRLEFSTTKSGNPRGVDLPAQAVECLSGMLESARETGAVRPGDLVFRSEGGGPMNPDTVTQAFGRTVRKVGLEGFRFHDLRHTHASLLLAEGVHAKVVSERLGHASIQITMDLYGHVMAGIQQEAAVKLSEKFAALEGVDLQKDLQTG